MALDDNSLRAHDDCIPVLDNRWQVLDDIFRVVDDSGKGQLTQTSQKMII